VERPRHCWRKGCPSPSRVRIVIRKLGLVRTGSHAVTNVTIIPSSCTLSVLPTTILESWIVARPLYDESRKIGCRPKFGTRYVRLGNKYAFRNTGGRACCLHRFDQEPISTHALTRASINLYQYHLPRYAAHRPTICVYPGGPPRFAKTTSSTFLFHRYRSRCLTSSLGTENFLLHANGHVTTNVWVTGNNKLRRVFMNPFSDKGHVNAKVVRLRCPDFSSKIK
jgi:hypothetical protein